MKGDRLCFSEVADAYPERWKRADPEQLTALDAGIETPRQGEFVVRRAESDESHPCTLFVALGEPYGLCECDGYTYNDGPCSHLCLVWRASQAYDHVAVPTARPTAVQADVLDRQQELADAVDGQPAVRADGGDRR